MYELMGNYYDLIKDYENGFDKQAVDEKFTDYFHSFDYVVGDWAYGKLRLKGFLSSSNKKVKKLNNYKYVDDYIKNKCAYGCKYFVLKKIDK